MKLKIPEWRNTDAIGFIKFWSDKYSYNLEHLYDNNIRQPLTEQRVWDLFKWKNGTEKIAKKKQQSIRTIYLPQLRQLPNLNDVNAGKTYLATLQGGAIWDIFWLHCLRPDLFPMFDQHTYRAMARINSLPLSEIPDVREQKIGIYFDQFIPFLHQFGQVNQRSLDKALFTYGRFLKWGFRGR